MPTCRPCSDLDLAWREKERLEPCRLRRHRGLDILDCAFDFGNLLCHAIDRTETR